MNMNIELGANELRTSDLYFAAYLQTAGTALVHTERADDGKTVFVFDVSNGDIDALRAAWFSSKNEDSSR